ncbi:MAG TPA: hypothetical protein VI386_17845 [Candidatus Sulfotelmatobacter sp.]
MTINQQAKIAAEVISGIMRQQRLTSDHSFGEIWSETASGFETYGSKTLVWTSFVREHNSSYWHKRLLTMVKKLSADFGWRNVEWFQFKGAR